MATSNNFTVHPSTQLPSPCTPPACLPPDLAGQVTVASHVFSGALGIMVWDILNNLKSDYLLLFKHHISLPTIAYFISRLMTLAFALMGTIFAITPSLDCARFAKINGSLYPVAVPATALLFFLRVRAVFNQNKFIVAFFALTWLAVLAACMMGAQGVTGSNLGSTDYCMDIRVEGYVAPGAIIPLINDTLVLLAISFRLISNTHREYNLKDGVRALIFGDYLPSFSRAFLQDGQAYYLMTVTTHVVTLIMFYLPTVPVAYRTMFFGPNVVTMNIMACRVFRHTKFGLIKQENTATSIKFRSRNEGTAPSVIPLSFNGNLCSEIRDDSPVVGRNMNIIASTQAVDHLWTRIAARASLSIRSSPI